MKAFNKAMVLGAASDLGAQNELKYSTANTIL